RAGERRRPQAQGRPAGSALARPAAARPSEGGAHGRPLRGGLDAAGLGSGTRRGLDPRRRRGAGCARGADRPLPTVPRPRSRRSDSLARARPFRVVAIVGRYAIGAAALVVICASLAVAAVSIRRRILGDWTGAPARLAESVIGLALLIGILEL